MRRVRLSFMTRRAGWCAFLLLLLIAVPVAAKRRSVSPGTGRCLFGVLDDNAYVSAIAIDATHAYYIDDFDLTLHRVPKDGGARTALTTFRGVIVTDVVVDETDVYISTIPNDFEATPPPGTVYAIPKSGGTRRTIASQVVVPIQLALDATHVYWISGGTYNFVTETVLADGKVERIRKDGSGRETLAQALSAPFGILVDGSDVYFSETGVATGSSSHGVRRIAATGGAVTHVQDTHVADIISQSATDIVFYGGKLDFSEAGIYRVPKSGGSVQQIFSGLDVYGGPRVFDGLVYFVTFDEEEFVDELWRVPVGGGTPQLVLTDLWNEYDFELDECGVYFGNAFGRVVKNPR